MAIVLLEGVPELRLALAKDAGEKRETRYGIENVIGSARRQAGRYGNFLPLLWNPGDEVLHPNPGYPIYESQITLPLWRCSDSIWILSNKERV